ncbi:hypothetical protein D9756_000740 [Leucocoprinus leucothites]|uniref:Small ribosomal subunit protein bS18m n=1 Tax=Leucocoprinus leucothites TaxID=201217 RepID=A0A8H5LNI6_9AGAR|nr:hypothetical protein D9756_000740 [Leucoagaricus leucothites]
MLASLRASLSRASHVATRRISTSSPLRNDPQLTTTDQLAEVLGNVTAPQDAQTAFAQRKKWRMFYAGDIVSPNELSPEKCANSRKNLKRPIAPPPSPVTRYNDVFRQLDLDPLDFSLNPGVLSAFTSEMGKIYGRNVTGLTARNQRRLGKAIRRARMVGVLPQLSKPTKLWVATPYRRLGR